MKKTIKLATILIFFAVLICGCTQTHNEVVNENDNNQTQMKVLENKGKDYLTEGVPERDIISIIDIATVKNKTDYSFKAKMKEEDNGMLIAIITINDADGNEVQKFTYNTEFSKE